MKNLSFEMWGEFFHLLRLTTISPSHSYHRIWWWYGGECVWIEVVVFESRHRHNNTKKKNIKNIYLCRCLFARHIICQYNTIHFTKCKEYKIFIKWHFAVFSSFLFININKLYIVVCFREEKSRKKVECLSRESWRNSLKADKSNRHTHYV